MTKLLLIEPYYSGSHRQWADGIVKHVEADIQLMTLPGRHWKWRMEGAAYHFAEEMLRITDLPDVVWVSDMINLETLRLLTISRYAAIPFCLYFHENQLTYPFDKSKVHDVHYGFINIKSAYIAERNYFNSQYNLDSFLSAAESLVKILPKPRITEQIKAIANKSHVLPVGIDLQEIKVQKKEQSDIKTIVWNHRWEHDKNPKLFFELLYRLQAEGIAFNLIMMGEQYDRVPEIFNEAKRRLTDHIIQWGSVPSREEYISFLCQSDIALITSNHEFFGISALESAYCGNIVIAPSRLSYPEVLSDIALYYANDNHAYDILSSSILKMDKKPTHQYVTSRLLRYDWSEIKKNYRDQIKIGSQEMTAYKI